MVKSSPVHDQIVRTLAKHAALDAVERAALRSLRVEMRDYAASTYLIREGQQPKRCAFVLEGFTYRQKVTIEGARAILSLQVPGDFVDLQNLLLQESDHDVQALTHVTGAEIEIADLRQLAETHPGINRSLWIYGLVESSISREWLLNLGRRDARTRTAHLLCEISARQQAAGLAREQTYNLPMTQEQLGDAVGLTAVHVNRVLRALESDGLIRRRKREVTIVDWQRLRRVADFHERYLHNGQETG